MNPSRADPTDHHLPPLPTFNPIKRMAPPPTNTANLTHMSEDQIISILHLLPPHSILSCSMTCRRLRSLASAPTLWESVCRREWGARCVDALLTSRHNGTTICWKRLYRELSQLNSLSCRRLPAGEGCCSVPGPRASHSLSFVSGCLVLFGGGCEGGRHLDDTWVAYVGNGFDRVISWQQVSSGIPSGRFGQSCTVVGDALVLFGGISDNGVRQNDTWIGQVIHEGPLKANISWRLLDVGDITPSSRGAHAACDAGDRRIVIHGGIGLDGLRVNDTWLLDLSDGLRSGKWHQISNARPSPTARSGHSLTWIGQNHIVLFGGRGSGYEVLNDVWILDMEGQYSEWKELKYDLANVSEDMPLPRSGHSATLILGSRVLIYGGEDSHRHRNDDFWVLDVGALVRSQTVGLKERKMWKKLRAEGHCPGYRSFHGACTDLSGRSIFVFGGMVDSVVHPGEAYGLRFDGELYLANLVLQY